MNDTVFDDLGFAKLDISRAERTGINETIFCPGKTNSQLLSILKVFQKQKLSVLGTKCSPKQADFIRSRMPDALYDETSGILRLDTGKHPELSGKIAVCTGGTADLPIAEEAAQTAEFFGAEVTRFFDVGIAGIHRLMSKIDEIRQADVVVAVAGMEGALAGVIAGLTNAPVIAVPTSVGYGASFQGLAPLLTMLNSCAEGIAVVNIDNGFGAGVMACRIIRKIQGKTK
ncbi:MAG: nickel pincer cofactor biosynthesis protein LarB [Alphaproteobacteria bacterium]|nr:nickel pincer cofactor biosynthesis protein LarB [Alphaproteobacteria bacterium]